MMSCHADPHLFHQRIHSSCRFISLQPSLPHPLPQPPRHPPCGFPPLWKGGTIIGASNKSPHCISFGSSLHYHALDRCVQEAYTHSRIWGPLHKTPGSTFFFFSFMIVGNMVKGLFTSILTRIHTKFPSPKGARFTCITLPTL